MMKNRRMYFIQCLFIIFLFVRRIFLSDRIESSSFELMDAQQALIERSLLQAAQTVEQQIDHQLQKLDNLGEDDLEVIRRKRLEELKRCVVVDSFLIQSNCSLRGRAYDHGLIYHTGTNIDGKNGCLEDMEISLRLKRRSSSSK